MILFFPLTREIFEKIQPYCWLYSPCCPLGCIKFLRCKSSTTICPGSVLRSLKWILNIFTVSPQLRLIDTKFRQLYYYFYRCPPPPPLFPPPCEPVLALPAITTTTATRHTLTQRFSFSPRYSVFATASLGPQSL